MESSVCPFCHLSVPSSELQWHANSHFEDEDKEANDMELGNQIQIASSSGSTDVVSISSLIGLQTRSNFYHVKDGLISLLRNCLELEARHNSSVTILSGYVDHFQSLPSVDVGWGCGWRNIQMLSSHLLAHRKEARKVLFGESGFVPDIAFLQRWLEIAWESGFDPPGAQHFNCKIYGTNTGLGLLNVLLFFVHLVFVLGWLILVLRNLNCSIFLFLVLLLDNQLSKGMQFEFLDLWINMFIASRV